MRRRVCNGCGPAGWRLRPIPQRIVGVVVTPACDVHDWMYHEGHNRFLADLFFLLNLMILCSRGSKILFPLRASLALVYFLAVYLCGGCFFGRKGERRHG
jgi:hypothetical protein